MRRFALFAVLALALVVVACAPPPAAEPEVEEPTEEQMAEEPTQEEAVTEEPAMTGNLVLERTTGTAGETRWDYGGCLGEGADSYLVDLECREITIAIENAYLPFNYVELSTGTPGGWDYDAIAEICTRLHCTPIFVEAAWEGMIQAVGDGQFDMAADGITINEERAKIVDFSNGYINIDQRLLVRKGEDRFSTMEEIADNPDLVLGTQLDTTNYETAIQYIPEEEVKTYEQFPFAVQALLAGEVDAVLIDEVAGQGYVGENADELEVVGPSYSSDQLGFIFPQGSDLVDPVNQAISAMKTDGSLNTLSTEYFGPTFTITYDDIGEGAYASEASEGEATEEPMEETPTLEQTTGTAGETRWDYGGCLGEGADSYLVDLECREITIAIENAYLPFNYVELSTGTPGGWDYDMLAKMCTRLHCTPIFVEAAWEGMIQAVGDGQFDMAADGITINEERAKIVDFSTGYINIDQRLLVRRGEDRFSTMEEIADNPDLVLGTQLDTTNYETAIQYIPEEEVKTYEQFPFAVQALLAGEVDAVLIDEVAGQGYVGENADELEVVGPSYSSDQLGFIFPQGSDLVDPVNQAINAMKADGSLEELSIKYFGPTFTITYEDIGEGAYAE
jgi:polar amino acid transport system substrate-binding protein